MYDELIKKLYHCANEVFCNKCPYSPDCAGEKTIIREAADAIEELSAINQRQLLEIAVLMTNPRWVSVTERLPDHYETVLLYIESEPEGYITIGSYDYREMRWKDFCDVNREVYQADVVSHWTPLPEPPKDGEP